MGLAVGATVGHVVRPVVGSAVSTVALISHAEITISHIEITHFVSLEVFLVLDDVSPLANRAPCLPH